MLSLFRHLPAFRQRIALGIALVFLFMASVGEAFHYKAHADTLATKAQSMQRLSCDTQQLGPVITIAAPDTFCALCQWESTLLAGAAFALGFVWTLAFAALRVRFVESPLLFVRHICALRDSRGPPSLA